MEKIRVFERKCLPACLRLYKTPVSNYTKFYSTKNIYNTADILRINIYIINLTSNHIIKPCNGDINNFVKAPYYKNFSHIRKTLCSGYIPPEAFVYFHISFKIMKEFLFCIIYIEKQLIKKNYKKHFNDR